MGLFPLEVDVLPCGLPQQRFLEFYSTRLNAVEVNYTFCGRRSVTDELAKRWLAQTPEDFVFAFRGPKPITHFHRHRLRHAEDRVGQFQTTLLPFQRANRLGPVLFQLPKSFTVDSKLLDDFLRNWPRELRISFEFRNASWFVDNIYAILRRHGAALCLAERDDMSTPEILTADFTYLRLRKFTYSVARLRELAKRIERYGARGDVFAFFRQDGDAGPVYAQEIVRRLQAGPPRNMTRGLHTA
jgi:uncharacterized protein YecE (DUF72 family)